jgi:hypothetical protein
VPAAYLGRSAWCPCCCSPVSLPAGGQPGGPLESPTTTAGQARAANLFFAGRAAPGRPPLGEQDESAAAAAAASWRRAPLCGRRASVNSSGPIVVPAPSWRAKTFLGGGRVNGARLGGAARGGGCKDAAANRPAATGPKTGPINPETRSAGPMQAARRRAPSRSNLAQPGRMIGGGGLILAAVGWHLEPAARRRPAPARPRPLHIAHKIEFAAKSPAPAACRNYCLGEMQH